MKILIAGVGALGSNLVSMLVPDLKGEHEITILDKDNVEERNLMGTQFYTPDQVGMSKVEALQYNVYKWHEKETEIIKEEITSNNADRTLINFADGLVIDCFDNHDARLWVHDRARARHINCLHIGFNPEFTFSCEWEPRYTVPTDLINAPDICELEGAGSFVKMVASLGSLVVQDFLSTGVKREFIGNRFNIREVK